MSAATDVRAIVPEGVAAPVSVPAEVFAAAVEEYLAGQKLDMQALAKRLGVGRATLYRRAGNRERLLDEVIWWQSRRALVTTVRRSVRLRGVARIVAVVRGIFDAVERDRALHAFLESDREAAMRILTGSRSLVQTGLATALERTIDLESERGTFASSLDTSTLAYAIQRLGEGFLYSDIIADRIPDIDRATTVVEALLRGLDITRDTAG